MRMSQNLILLPVFGQVLLTVAVLVIMALARQRSMAERRQGLDDVALAGAGDWNEQATKAANNYRNQFEIPVLFYAACAFALATRMVDVWLFGLACLFVLSRYVHSAIHIGPNRIIWRGPAFLVGTSAVCVMWILLLTRLAQSGF